MWYKNVDLGKLIDYLNWDEQEYFWENPYNKVERDIKEVYPDMFELKDIKIPSYTLFYDEDENIDYSNVNKIFFLEFHLSFILPNIPKNRPDTWVKNKVEYIIGEISLNYPEFIEMEYISYISGKKICKCTMDIKKNDVGKYELYIYGDIKGKVISKDKPKVDFYLDF